MHTCIPSHRLKRSWHSCPRQVNAGDKKHTQHETSMKMECDYLNGWIKNSHIRKISPKMVSPRDAAGERRRRKRRRSWRINPGSPTLNKKAFTTRPSSGQWQRPNSHPFDIICWCEPQDFAKEVELPIQCCLDVLCFAETMLLSCW